MQFRRFLLVILATLGGFFAVVIGVSIIGYLLFFSQGRHPVPKMTILELDLEKRFVDYQPVAPISGMLQEETPSVYDTVDAIEKAGRDERVLGLIARVGSVKMGLAKIQELRNAIFEFRRSGKRAVAFAETFGEFGPGNEAYYLATAFDKIYLQPSGDVGLTGLMASASFFRGTLEKLGITPNVDKRGKYKTAVNTFTEDKFTDAHREASLAVMNSRFDQITKGIADARKLSQDDVKALIDRGPCSASDAVSLKLVDGLAYRDEAHEALKRELNEEARFLAFSKYRESAGRESSKGATIALIFGAGEIHRGKSRPSLLGVASMGSETVSKAFRLAIDDKDVRAIVFRVDSPGGSVVASDTIWRETVRAKKAGKPVVVSMSDLAASGGYYVSMAANKIVAQPGTLTGSIGVFAGKAVTMDFWNKLGVTWDEVHTSQNSTFWTNLYDYSEPQWATLESWVDRIYEDFVSKVAEGRTMDKDRVQSIAQGRVWSGETAKALGLVDELGGIPEAVHLAKQEAGIAETENIRFKLFPERKTLFERLKAALLGSQDEDAAAVDDVFEEITIASRLMQTAAFWAHKVGLAGSPGVLRTPDADPIP